MLTSAHKHLLRRQTTQLIKLCKHLKMQFAAHTQQILGRRDLNPGGGLSLLLLSRSLILQANIRYLANMSKLAKPSRRIYLAHFYMVNLTVRDIDLYL
jgi:hypothetical protein